ncbi:MAG: ABC transporter permease [Truepera sp.]|nr:ABC transporter permease [Truepera sp.]
MSGLFNVIRAELFKAKRKRRTYILAGLLWVVLPILILIVGRILQTNLSGSFVEDTVGVQTLVQQVASPFAVARLNLILPVLSSPPFLMIVIALFAALLVGEERNQNMWKTTLVTQPNRWSVLFGKIAVGMILYGIILAGAFLSGILFGAVGTLFLDTTFAGEWGHLAGLYALQWVLGIGAMMFAFLAIWLLRNVAMGIVTVLFLPTLIEGLYTLYRTTVGFQPLNRFNALFQMLRLRQTLEDLPRYFFTRNLYAPARDPLSDVVIGLGGDPASSDLGSLVNALGGNITLQHATLVTIGYALALGGVLIWSFLKRDIQ